MSAVIYSLAALVLSALTLLDLHLMNRPETAVRGNRLGALAMAGAIIMVGFKSGALSLPMLWVSMAVGAGLGLVLAMRVKMIQMPQMVALLHGLGGTAAVIVAVLVLLDGRETDLFTRVTAAIALIVGGLTATGSFVAAGKLHQVLPQKPIVLARHSVYTALLLGFMAVLLLILCMAGAPAPLLPLLLTLLAALGFGVLFTVRVGGADMPITISLLNSLSGVAEAAAGMAIASPLLVAVGGIVGTAGLILTQIMCRAMNRNLMDILLGKTSVLAPSAAPKATEGVTAVDTTGLAAGVPGTDVGAGAGAEADMAAAAAASEDAPAVSDEALAGLLKQARAVLIVPGYGMALSQAQHEVKALATALEKNGASVDYAIHPVAGRMPGHMNVLLAEADVDYDHLLEMDAANPLFKDSDLVIVIGASDVINPAANTAEGTPIYGMPILNVAEAAHVIICNFDRKPGYAGVPNPLYTKAGVFFLEGDAVASVERLKALLLS